MTLKEMNEYVTRILLLEGIQTPPAPAVLLGTLNMAKDDITARMAAADETRFLMTKDYQANSTINLYADSDDDGYVYRVMRIVGLYWVHSADDLQIIPIRDRRTDESEDEYDMWAERIGPYMYIRPSSMAVVTNTIRLYFIANVPDINGANTDLGYDFPGSSLVGVDREYVQIICLQAVCDLLPANNAGRAKWLARLQEKRDDILRALSSFKRERHPCIKRVGDYG